jgi:FlaA1/EpsC-like NDP-sugar epimerase
MTIPEASQLIMEAASVGEGGEIFVLDMGKPIKIGYLAEQMIRLSGKVPGEDIDIEYIGLRPGEKMYEELFHEDEDLAETKHSKLFLSKARGTSIKNLAEQLTKLEVACGEFEDQEIRVLLKKMVPEFSSQSI